jgi:phytoene/squalene synthetase
MTFFQILALNAEISVIRQKILRNSGVTGIYQLQFWKDVLNTLAGQMKGPVPRQPVVKALQAQTVVTDDNLPLLQELVSARQETLGDRPFASVDKLEANSRAVHGTLIRLIVHQLTGELHGSDAVGEVADQMGIAVGVATLLRLVITFRIFMYSCRATVPLLKEGVVLLPLDLLSLYGLKPDAFFRGEFPSGMKEVTKDLCKVNLKTIN